jgi:REP element-mobilizing transposase RayT
MSFDPRIHHRRSIRLKGYDYAQPGAYFATIVTHRRECLFAQILDGEIHLTPFGLIVRRAWLDLPKHYRYKFMDEFCIMPNHIHGIIILAERDGRGGSGPSSNLSGANTLARSEPESAQHQTRPYDTVRWHGLTEIVRAFKSFSARRINTMRRTARLPVWQRNYYEHIIRNEKDLHTIRQYIQDNPMKWELDEENPQ